MQALPHARRSIAFAIATLLGAAVATGQEQAELVQLRAKKLAKPVFHQAAWRTDFDAAQKEAKAAGKLLLVYFTRSYAH